jgi:hypothetical protein
MFDFEGYTDDELRAQGDIVVVYRRHVPWDAPRDWVLEDAIEFSRFDTVNFILAKLRLDALDMRAVSFTYRFIQDVDDYDIRKVRAHIASELEVHLVLRRIRRDFYTRE